MREIKFRAWIPSPLQKEEYPKVGSMYYWKLNFQSQGGAEGIKHDTVMQYTGLKDSKNIEIYDGDIVQYIKDNGVDRFKLLGKIEYCEDSFECRPVNNRELIQYNNYRGWGEGSTPFYGYDGREFGWEQLEVIGNIYENKELLK